MPLLTLTRPLLRPDGLMLVGFTAHEALSQLFRFDLELVAKNTQPVLFETILGQPVTVELELAEGQKRSFDGICHRLAQGERDPTFTRFHMEVVPRLWLLTRKLQSRIFNDQLTVPQLLKKVLVEEWQLNVAGFETLGPFPPRDFVVQYRETDFDFVSRLMEDEGIYYFFYHAADGHQLILGDKPLAHPELPVRSRLPFFTAEERRGDREGVSSWAKLQELRSGKSTVWDYHFQLPDSHLEATRRIQESVQVGQVPHQLSVSYSERLERYDYPGGYAERFDGISKGGTEQPEKLAPPVFLDNQRTVDIRMQEEATPGLRIQGASDVRHLASGFRFNLEGHFNADGPYVLTSVRHSARNPDYRSSNNTRGATYHNTFVCTPAGLPFRPPRTTRKPVIAGTQTAVVVGQPGEEISVDKHGRVKVQFNWDRQGQKDLGSSCWVRVAQLWAGNTFGTVFWPRVGHEVVVAFEEGDPDRPIIIGSVYNARNVTPRELPKRKNRTGFFTQSTPGGNIDEFNALGFDDTRGQDLVYIRAQKDFRREVGNNDYLVVGNEQVIEIKNGRKMTIKQGGESTTVEQGDVVKTYKGDYYVDGDKDVEFHGNRIGLFNNDEKAGLVVLPGSVAFGVNDTGIQVTEDSIEMWAPTVKINAREVHVTGLVSCKALITNFVNSPGYTHGTGNET